MKLKKLLLLAVSNVKVEVHYALDNGLIEPKDYAYNAQKIPCFFCKLRQPQKLNQALNKHDRAYNKEYFGA